MIAYKYEQLEKLSLEELKRSYDVSAQNTVVGLGFFREEIARRDHAEDTKVMLALTRQMRNMTLGIAVLTILNVVLVAVTLWK